MTMQRDHVPLDGPRPLPPPTRYEGGETANDRFKKSFGAWLWGSILAAVVVHFAILAFFPAMGIDDISFDTTEIRVVEIPPHIELPPPPEQIQRPAAPVITDVAIEQEVTIAPTTFDQHRATDLPPPPTAELEDLSARPTFTPYTTPPDVLNREEVARALEREYPPTLRDVGIGGTVLMHFFLDENGVVGNFLVADTSGHAALDHAALRVAEVFRFSPAYNRDDRVPVWVQIPVTFEAR